MAVFPLLYIKSIDRHNGTILEHIAERCHDIRVFEMVINTGIIKLDSLDQRGMNHLSISSGIRHSCSKHTLLAILGDFAPESQRLQTTPPNKKVDNLCHFWEFYALCWYIKMHE